MRHSKIDEIFNHLDKWRLLPAYQLERRADIFFAIYLPQILRDNLKNRPILKIIPEFPVRIGTIYPKIQNNRSFKIDYLVISDEKVLLVELKTENNSRRTKQDMYLEKARDVNTKELIEGLIQISKATKSRVKYRRLMYEFKEIGWLEELNGLWKNTCQNNKIEIVYIQPESDKKSEGKSIISFEKVAEIIELNKSELSTRFAKSLRNWKKSTNEE